MQNKTISVVIPAYNRRDTILRAVNSALNQTYPVLEVIVVDDCSTDGTAEIVEKLCESRIRVLHNSRNFGACKSRNIGIEAASGEFIALLDSDDEWMLDKMERQMSALELSGADVCSCRFVKIYDEAANSETGVDEILPKCSAGFLTRDCLVKESRVSTQTIIASKKVFDRYMFDDNIKRLQDYEWTIRASKEFSFYLLDDALVNVFLQDDSITNGGLKKLSDAFEVILNKHCASLVDEPKLLSYLYVNAGRSCARIGNKPSLYYKSALKLNFDPKIAVKLFLSMIGYYK